MQPTLMSRLLIEKPPVAKVQLGVRYLEEPLETIAQHHEVLPASIKGLDGAAKG